MVLWSLVIAWAKLINEFTYIAIFLISLLGTSTLFIPFPLDSLISFASFTLNLNPFLVGIFAGLGSSLGEMTGYLFGLGSRTLAKKKIRKKTSKFVSFVTAFFKKHGFWIIPIAAFIPFPFDIIGISAGIGNYDAKKFFIATLIGRILRCMLIAYAGYKLIPFVEQFW
jgi:membrane protein DedA with SNARE-associated domain